MPRTQLVDSITCSICGKTSYHPKDIEYRYCGFCHRHHKPEDGIVTSKEIRKSETKLMNKFNPIVIVEDLCACAIALYTPDGINHAGDNEVTRIKRSMTFIDSMFHVIDACISMMDPSSLHDIIILDRMCAEVGTAIKMADNIKAYPLIAYIRTEVSNRVVFLNRKGEEAMQKKEAKKLKRAASILKRRGTTRKFWASPIIDISRESIITFLYGGIVFNAVLGLMENITMIKPWVRSISLVITLAFYLLLVLIKYLFHLRLDRSNVNQQNTVTDTRTGNVEP